ncbi:MAG: phospholipid carrier-dependent glycosyltransferase [Chitinispirillaceae bacterium]|nr:phospholipid carrier-dependent glycosyltransferase [Chitinispirillaceae bacterium]
MRLFQLRGPRRALAVEIALVVLSCSVFLVMGMGKRASAPFHIDEAHKIAETFYYTLFFKERAFSSPDWNSDFYARTNPPVAKYIMGAILDLRGHRQNDRALQDHFERLWQDPQRLARLVPHGLLMDARAVSVVFGVLTLLMIYLTGRFCGAPLAGATGALLLAAHPLFAGHATIALTDTILLFFMSAAAPVAIIMLRLLRPQTAASRLPRWCGPAAGVLLCSLVVAGAAGTKLNGALAGFLVVSVLLVAMVRAGLQKRSGAIFAHLLAIAGITVCSVALFVVLNPFLYGAPFQKIVQTFAVYDDWMLKQAIDPGRPLWGMAQKIAAIAYFNFWLPQSVVKVPGGALMFMAFLMGMSFLCREVFTNPGNRGRREGPVVVLMMTALYGMGIGLWIPVNWDRYFLPLAPIIALCCGFGLVFLCKAIPRLARMAPRTGSGHWAWLAAPACLALVLWIGCVDYALVPPDTFRQYDHLDAFARHHDRPAGDHPIKLLNDADVRFASRDPYRASAGYEAALRRLERMSRSNVRDVLIAAGTFSLAESYHVQEKAVAAQETLRRHIGALTELTAHLRTHDPKVTAEFVKLIDRRKQLLVQIGGVP